MIKIFNPKALTLSLCFIAGIVMIACEKNSWQGDSPQSTTSKSVAYMDEYLYFPSGYDGIDDKSITDADNDVILKALQRVKVVNEEGFYRIDAPSAAEINVSPEVFTAMEQIAVRSNLKQMEALLNKSLIPRLRQTGEPGDSESETKWDCVPKCIGSIASLFGYNSEAYYKNSLSYMSSHGWTGNGVPSGQVGSFFGSVFGEGNVTELNNRNPAGWVTNRTNTVTTLGIGVDNGGHQVIYNGMTTDSTSVIYIDPQNEGKLNFTSPDSVYTAHKITK